MDVEKLVDENDADGGYEVESDAGTHTMSRPLLMIFVHVGPRCTLAHARE